MIFPPPSLRCHACDVADFQFKRRRRHRWQSVSKHPVHRGYGDGSRIKASTARRPSSRLCRLKGSQLRLSHELVSAENIRSEISGEPPGVLVKPFECAWLADGSQFLNCDHQEDNERRCSFSKPPTRPPCVNASSPNSARIGLPIQSRC
jgi:hypothetical protein